MGPSVLGSFAPDPFPQSRAPKGQRGPRWTPLQPNPLELLAQGLLYRLSICFFTISCFMGCGSDRSNQQDPPPPQLLPLLTSRERPQTYVLHDSSCQNRMELGTNPLPLSNAWVRQISPEGLTERQVKLFNTQTQISLRSTAVVETTYGEVYERVCDFRKQKNSRCRNNQGSELSYLRKSNPKSLRICQDAYRFPKDSYESVALTSIVGIDETFRFYQSIAPKGAEQTPQISLSILPTFEEVYDYFPHQGALARYKTYLTHNLAYFPDVSEVVVFPESVLSLSSQNLWESPFVLSHEYAHHIDHVRHRRLYNRANLRWSPFSHQFVDAVDEGRLDLAIENTAPDDLSVPVSLSPRSLLMTSLSEAFADILAYYSQGESGSSLSVFSDIGVDRDLGQAQLASNLPKILRKDYLEVFFNQGKNREPISSDLSQMTGVHTIGAIVAYGTNRFFTKISEARTWDQNSSETPPGSATAQTKFKYRLLLFWMNAIVEDLTKLPVTSTGDECLKSLVKGFKATLEQGINDQEILLSPEEQSELRNQLVGQLGELFPAFEL
jgi:hypothetical protein